MVWFKKEVFLKLSDGSALVGPLHPGWSEKTVGSIVTKTVDLKSAYKQFAIKLSDRKRSVIAVKSGEKSEPMGFVGSVLPFGASAAVMSFYRISRLLWRVFVEAGVVRGAYFDDVPILDFETTSKSAGLTVRAICKLLGMRCSEEKEVEFSEKTPLLP